MRPESFELPLPPPIKVANPPELAEEEESSVVAAAESSVDAASADESSADALAPPFIPLSSDDMPLDPADEAPPPIRLANPPLAAVDEESSVAAAAVSSDPDEAPVEADPPLVLAMMNDAPSFVSPLPV